jgi:CheY-like chemotaxis protein
MIRIIVIEPEMRARHALRGMLEGAGYQVETAADGDDGLAMHQSRPADLIIADLDDAEERVAQFHNTRFIAVPSADRATTEGAHRMGAGALLH